MNLPLVSVLTPSFNQGRYLPDCLSSVRNQTYGRVEHIVYDGGSTDNSVEILRQSDTIWVSANDEGQADAVNKAFRRSNGDIIGWLNSDDGYIDRRVVAWVVEMFESDPSVGVIIGGSLLIDETNRVLQVQPGVWVGRRALVLNNFIVQPATFIRRSALAGSLDLLRTELSYVMDRDLWFRLLDRTKFVATERLFAFDRHQRKRKVETHEFHIELAHFDGSLGIRHSRASRTVVSLFRMWLRTKGVVTMLMLPKGLDPAIELMLPSRTRRLLLQLFLRRRYVGFAAQ